LDKKIYSKHRVEYLKTWTSHLNELNKLKLSILGKSNLKDLDNSIKTIQSLIDVSSICYAVDEAYKEVKENNA